MDRVPKIQVLQDLNSSSADGTSKLSLRRKSSTSPLKAQMQPAFVQKLESDRRKLNSVESQQIISVVDDALMTLHVISRFGSICDNYDYFEEFLGPEIAAGFQHLCLALKYSDNYESSCNERKAAEADGQFVDSMKDMSSSQKLGMYSAPPMKKIRDVIKTLARLIHEKRDVYNSLSMDSKPSQSMLELLQSMEELRTFVFERLQTTEAKEKERILFSENSPLREKVLKTKIEELEWELACIKSTAAEEVNQLTAKIAQLEDDIEKMVMISSEAILQRRMDTFHEVEVDEKFSKERKVNLDLEYQASLRQYDTLLNQHRNAELNLRKKNFKISVEMENWIMKYDKDITERLATLETLSTDYIDEKQKLDKIEVKFAPVEDEYKALTADRSAKEQKRLAGMLKEVKYVNAAVIIQKYIRGFLARKRYKQLKKKKK